jgi:hypothetical protein
MLHQVGDLFELHAKLRCQKVRPSFVPVITVAVTCYRACIFHFKLMAIWTLQLVLGPQIVSVMNNIAKLS